MNAFRILALVLAGAMAPSASSQEATPPFVARLETGTTFLTENKDLQRLYYAAERVLAGNRARFTPAMEVLVEGGGYPNAWIETQPMGGEMFARRDPQSYDRYWGHKLAEGQPRPTREDLLVPFASMDVMAYSYSARATLAVIAKELGTGKAEHWHAQADDVRQRLIDHLWDEDRHACFDQDRLGRRLPELIHNNLRCMWYGIFTQDMADAFIRHHLLNPRAFWTPVPLVSVAIDDPLYENAPGNNWSGQPQGLTYQRAIDALERYGHFAEVTLLSNKLLPVLIRNDCHFAQQLDAMTGKPSGQKPDGYGPMALAALEYLSRAQGIHLDVANNRVWWGRPPTPPPPISRAPSAGAATASKCATARGK